MSMIDAMMAELAGEAKTTRRVLERIPEEHFGFKPHEKSMTFLQLACHTVNILDWMKATLTMDEFVFDPATFKPWVAAGKKDLLETFDKHLAVGLKLMEGLSVEALQATWSMKVKDTRVLSMPRAAVLRTMIFNHLVHHRGQMTVYLRLLDVPVPQIYGPSADEPDMRPAG